MKVLLTHDAPAGVVFEGHCRDINWPSNATGLDDLVRGVRPLVCFLGHHHTRLDSEIGGVRCISLYKLQMPGNLVAIEMPERGREWSILGKWPPRMPSHDRSRLRRSTPSVT